MTPELLTWVRDNAARWDREPVTRADTDRLAAAGLYALTGPPELGGVSLPQHREAAELLAGASPDLWFVWFQHGPVVRMVAAVEELQSLLPDLCSGRTQAGVAFSHLRGGHPSITAKRDGDGWLLEGRQPWGTGFGIADVFLVGAHVPESDEVLLGLVPAEEVGSAGELDLMTMRGTSTHALRLDGARLADSRVVVRKTYDEWTAADRVSNSNVQPSTFGLASAALDLLAPVDPETELALRARVDAVRTEAYALIDEQPPEVDLERRLELRAEALLLAMSCATAAVASRGGRAVGLNDPAQRLLRAAAFQLIHAQAPHVRAATMSAIRRSTAAGG